MPSRVSLCGIAALLLVGCGGRAETSSRALSRPVFAGSGEAYGRYQMVGQASWYGEELRGNRTASGAMFDPRAITAAHRTLPLGSFVEVTSIETGRSIVALVNDRGPGRKDRIIDLSRAAAQLLGTDRRPVAMVRVRTIIPTRADAAAIRGGRAGSIRPIVAVASVSDARTPLGLMPLDEHGRYRIRIATFSSKSRARALADALDGDAKKDDGLWCVTLGPFKGAAATQRARDAVARRGYGDAQIVRED